MSRIFVSYASEDRDIIGPIASRLQNAGHEVWWDIAIRGGDDWTESIERELQSADAVVIFWSKHSVESPWVRIEAHHGKQRGILIPVRIDDAALPDEYRRLQTIDANASDAISKIDTALNALSAKKRRRLTKTIASTLMVSMLALIILVLVTSKQDSGDDPSLGADSNDIYNAATLDELRVLRIEFSGALEVNPNDVLSQARLCATLLRTFELTRRDSDLAAAERPCLQSLATQPDNWEVQEANGGLAHYQGEVEKAQEHFLNAGALNPAGAASLVGLAETYERQGDLIQAEHYFAEATVLQPASWRVQNAMALYLQRVGKIPESIKRFELALILAPDNIAILNNLGVSRLFNQDYAGAVSAFNQILFLVSLEDQGPTLTNIGAAYYLMRDFPAARSAYEKSTRLMGDDYRSWANLADTCLALQLNEEAMSYYRRALDRVELALVNDETDELAIASKASFLAALGDSSWKTILDGLLAKGVQNPEVYRLTALSHVRSGNRSEAKAALTTAINLGYPKDLLTADIQFDGLLD